MPKGSLQWDNIWKKQGYISDYMLRWYDYLKNISKSLLPEKAKVLEIGCGTGRGISIFSKDHHESYGLDISEIAIKCASKEFKNVNFICEDLFNMKFERNSFDLIFNSGLIEHFKYPKNIEALKLMASLLKHNGKLIISVPNKLCPWYTFGKNLLIKLNKWEYGFEEGYSPAIFKKYIEEVIEIKLNQIFGMQALPIFATTSFQLLPFSIRKIIAKSEVLFPFKQYYSYAIVAECIKIK